MPVQQDKGRRSKQHTEKWICLSECCAPKAAPPNWAPASRRSDRDEILCHSILSPELGSRIGTSAFQINSAERRGMSHFAGEVQNRSAESTCDHIPSVALPWPPQWPHGEPSGPQEPAASPRATLTTDSFSGGSFHNWVLFKTIQLQNLGKGAAPEHRH